MISVNTRCCARGVVVCIAARREHHDCRDESTGTTGGGLAVVDSGEAGAGGEQCEVRKTLPICVSAPLFVGLHFMLLFQSKVKAETNNRNLLCRDAVKQLSQGSQRSAKPSW